MIDLAWSSNNARLSAPRRYGKTSLLKATLAEADKHHGFKTVYVDLHGVVDLADIAGRIDTAYEQALTGALTRWFAGLRRTLKPVVRMGGGVIPGQLEVAPNGDHPLIQRLHLPEKVHERTGDRMIIVFDEFQEVLTAGDNSDKIIRSVIQHHGEIASYIFAGSHIAMMQELFSSRDRAFYAQASPIALRPLRPDDLGEWIAARFDATGKDVGEALGSLLDLAQGHPQRSMLLAHHLWRATPPRQQATVDTWLNAFDAAVAGTSDEITAIWDHLKTYYRRVITVIAQNQYRLKAQQTGLSTGAATNDALRALLGSGEIIEDPSAMSGYRVTDPLFAYWARTGRH